MVRKVLGEKGLERKDEMKMKGKREKKRGQKEDENKKGG